MNNNTINWIFYPKSREIPIHLSKLIECVFEKHLGSINSTIKFHSSNEVLSIIREDLIQLGYEVEKGKSSSEKIKVPVLFGKNGSIEKYFDADGFNKTDKTVIEVEAGRGYTNNQFLKDLFQASVMYDVDYLVIAVRNIYKKSNDFEKVSNFFETLYASTRLNLPLKGILLIGY